MSNPNSGVTPEQLEKERLEKIEADKALKNTLDEPLEKIEADKTLKNTLDEPLEIKPEEDLVFIPEKPEVKLNKPISTGNAKLDLLQDMLYEKDVDHLAIIKEIRDTNTLSVEVQTDLIAKFGKAGFNNLVSSYKEIQTEANNNNKSKKSALMKQIATGAMEEGATEEQAVTLWKEKITPWLHNELSKENIIQYSNMLKQGGIQAELAMSNIIKEYKMSAGFNGVGTQENAGSLGTPVPTGIRIKNHMDLADQLRKAENEGDAVKIKQIEDRFENHGFN